MAVRVGDKQYLQLAPSFDLHKRKLKANSLLFEDDIINDRTSETKIIDRSRSIGNFSSSLIYINLQGSCEYFLGGTRKNIANNEIELSSGSIPITDEYCFFGGFKSYFNEKWQRVKYKKQDEDDENNLHTYNVAVFYKTNEFWNKNSLLFTNELLYCIPHSFIGIGGIVKYEAIFQKGTDNIGIGTTFRYIFGKYYFCRLFANVEYRFKNPINIQRSSNYNDKLLCISLYLSFYKKNRLDLRNDLPILK